MVALRCKTQGNVLKKNRKQQNIKHDNIFFKLCVFQSVVLFSNLLTCFLIAYVVFSKMLLYFQIFKFLTGCHSHWLHGFPLVTSHSLPPHLSERRAHLLPMCNVMNNIFIIKLLTLIHLPSNYSILGHGRQRPLNGSQLTFYDVRAPLTIWQKSSHVNTF